MLYPVTSGRRQIGFALPAGFLQLSDVEGLAAIMAFGKCTDRLEWYDSDVLI